MNISSNWDLFFLTLDSLPLPHPQLAPLYLCKLSSILSEQAFIAQLQSFTQSKEKRIMVLVSSLTDALNSNSCESLCL